MDLLHLLDVIEEEAVAEVETTKNKEEAGEEKKGETARAVQVHAAVPHPRAVQAPARLLQADLHVPSPGTRRRMHPNEAEEKRRTGKTPKGIRRGMTRKRWTKRRK